MASDLDHTEPPSLKALMSHVKTIGARVNNLFHRMDGMWQANLRSRDAMSYFQWGYGPTPEDALRSAIKKFNDGKRVAPTVGADDERDPRQVGTTEEGLTPLPPADDGPRPAAIDDLLS